MGPSRRRPREPGAAARGHLFMRRHFHYCVFLLVVLTQLACSDDTSSAGRSPECRITSPDSGSVISFGDTLTVTAEASDPGGDALSVEFYVNGTLWFVDREPPYEYTLDGIAYRKGSCALTAAAVGEGGARAVDTAVVSIVSEATPAYGFRVIDSYDHDPSAFTQGLIYDEGFFYEGTGRYGRSSIRRVDIETGDVLMIRNLPDEYFGEGIAVLGETLFQLTYLSRVGFIYNKADFDSLGFFTYETQGWGLTTDGESLIMSDGSAVVHFMEPSMFEITRDMVVTDQGSAVSRLNELELIEGDLFANIFGRSRIARIALDGGEVIGWIDLGELAAPYGTDVLNGIAYDARGHRLFVTGKNWDKVYEIELTY